MAFTSTFTSRETLAESTSVLDLTVQMTKPRAVPDQVVVFHFISQNLHLSSSYSLRLLEHHGKGSLAWREQKITPF